MWNRPRTLLLGALTTGALSVATSGVAPAQTPAPDARGSEAPPAQEPEQGCDRDASEASATI